MTDPWEDWPRLYPPWSEDDIRSYDELRHHMIKWKSKNTPIINEALEKAKKWDTEYQERDALVKLQKIKAIVTEYGPVPEDMVSDIEDILEESVERELRAEKGHRHSLEMKLEAIKNFWDYLLTTAFKDATVGAIWSEKRGMNVDISLWLHDELEEWNKQHLIKILEASG